MNTKITALTLAAATAFAFAPAPAKAGNTEVALIGGLIGGAIIASALSDHDHDRTVVVSSGYGHRYEDRRAEGYWKTVEVRVWVPGYWVSERHHGRTIRTYVSGHYECRPDRVWVAYDRHDRRDRSYGYDSRDRNYRH